MANTLVGRALPIEKRRGDSSSTIVHGIRTTRFRRIPRRCRGAHFYFESKSRQAIRWPDVEFRYQPGTRGSPPACDPDASEWVLRSIRKRRCLAFVGSTMRFEKLRALGLALARPAWSLSGTVRDDDDGTGR